MNQRAIVGFSRRTGRNITPCACESLEPRLVLATYSLTDYLPAANLDHWEFAGTADGRRATATVTIRGDINSSAEIELKTSVGFVSDELSLRVKRTSSGFVMSEIVDEALGDGVRMDLSPTVPMLPALMRDGQRVSFNTRITATLISDPSVRLTGTINGQVQVIGSEFLVTPAGRFNTVHVRTSMHATATFQGETGVIDTVQDWWLAKNVGFVRVDDRGTTTADGETESTSASLMLESYSRAGEHADIQITGNGIAIRDGDATPRTSDSTAFGSRRLGDARVREFTVRNMHDSRVLRLNRAALSGPNAGDFTIVSGGNARTLGPGEQATIAVRFRPGATGARNASITIANSDPDEAAFTFKLRGKGTPAPDIAVRGNGVAIVSGDTLASAADNTSFGRVAVGASQTRSFTIANTGNAGLRLSGDSPVTILPFSGAGGSGGGENFVVIQQPAPTLARGSATTTFTIRYTATSTLGASAVVSIASNDPNESPYTFVISGVGASNSKR